MNSLNKFLGVANFLLTRGGGVAEGGGIASFLGTLPSYEKDNELKHDNL